MQLLGGCNLETRSRNPRRNSAPFYLNQRRQTELDVRAFQPCNIVCDKAAHRPCSKPPTRSCFSPSEYREQEAMEASSGLLRLCFIVFAADQAAVVQERKPIFERHR